MTMRETRLARWSRLKARERLRAEKPEQAPLQERPAPSSAARSLASDPDKTAMPANPEPANPEKEAADAVDLEALAREHDLPSPETLDAGSDFSRFMREDVPEILKRAALRRLWASDPVFANLDGLNDYDEDFSVVRAAAGAIAERAHRVADALKEGNEAKAEDASRPAGSTPGEPPVQESEEATATKAAEEDDGQVPSPERTEG